MAAGLYNAPRIWFPMDVMDEINNLPTMSLQGRRSGRNICSLHMLLAYTCMQTQHLGFVAVLSTDVGGAVLICLVLEDETTQAAQLL